MEVQFWGVRGTVGCPGPDYQEYGGNTSCVEVRCGDKRILLDAGTGIRNFGRTSCQTRPCDLAILLTHTHWDHISGFPFFAPAYAPGNRFRIMAGHLKEQTIAQVLSGQMVQPYFPVPMEVMQADLEFEDFNAGDTFILHDDIRVITAPLNHPGGATGYRIEHGGRAFCYVTDTEHVPGKIDETILGLIEGADLVLYDATYTEEEFKSKIGWGHSTWEEGVKLAKEAGVKQLGLFHHDPDHTDPAMRAIEKAAQERFSGAFACREGSTITL